VTLQLLKPNSDGGEIDEAHEVGEELVISGRDAAELLKLVEQALDEIALFVEINVPCGRRLKSFLRFSQR
jgi:hypothetical protein